ncbi:hypothetical protein ILUMI_04139 [Ignelater luminosus]|uniref:Integrin beta n=1 Tax=Ignelater luminosus TaxID=2038154 RepID=A0A8K0GEU3_IGNLU|nr:hypothetical protein ILUMI_04139 [Ignelater luminosus]
MTPKPTQLVQIFLWIVCLYISQLKADTYLNKNRCISKTRCDECIQTPSCAWCYEPAETFGDHPRCYQPAGGKQLHKQCAPEYEYFPNNFFNVTIKKRLTSEGLAVGGGGGGFAGGAAGAAWGAGGAAASGSASASGGSFSQSSSAEMVQITPQRVHLKLRARESYSFHVQYAQAEDYPVDLYYLMDLSKSMEDDKDKLSVLGNKLAETMQAMTKDFKLGFGSFVDKVVMPYVSTVPSKLRRPCTNCTAPYGYKNHLTLNNDTTKFSEMVRSAKVSGNLDAPEGGFDAIMQAVVCTQQIGWRDKARKLLVFSTDDGFHYAGDGKLGGIIRPNDGRCHLQDNYYSYSSIQDYPSISQLNLKIKQQAINVIFAVTEKQIGVYNKLKEHIEGASSGMLSDDSSNVVELVRKQYEAISSTVEMRDNATGGVVIKYYSKCLNTGAELENNTNMCENFKVGERIDFRLEVFLKECPEKGKSLNQTIQVYPVGLSESVFIDLEMLCSCPCEKPGDVGYEEHSPRCSGFGTYKCGICECDKLHTGRKCECLQGAAANKNATGCRPPGSTDTAECSGKGTCICDRCECDQRENANETISGFWCECDNYSCYRHGGEICGGHGTCECGKCQCLPNWSGDACECYTETDTCYPPHKKDKKICDGHGQCKCGVCQCDTNEQGKYTGRYCERCPNCTETCDELKPCVLCQMYHVGPYNDNTCVEKCGNFTPEEVEVIRADEQNDEFPCAGSENHCRYVFVYKKLNETHYAVKAPKELECPPKVFILGLVLGVIAAVVLMGLAILLLWKLLTTIHDRREFAKFEKERMMAKWDTGENPIYKQATSTFKNPTYAGKG